jgi:4-deoxy-L-threo-5-hexosulose-uronate ketol-isomerase
MRMDTRYSVNAQDFKTYTTKEIRTEFLIERVFEENRITAVYSHVDRMVTLGAMPKDRKLYLNDAVHCPDELGTPYFLAGREMGVINIGGAGSVNVDGISYGMSYLEGLYIPKECKDVVFEADDPQNAPKFFLSSVPAHHAYDVKHIAFDSAISTELGDQSTSNARIQRQYIHPDVVNSCQLLMGVTTLKEGSVWNTMPPHLHERRMEVYMYFDVKKGEFVCHFMGEPDETRHIIMQNEQAVISPSWSIHSGCGTSKFSFVWAMAGENRDFNDMVRLNKEDIL